jgi:DNA polymerase-3 subunit epsilon
MSTPWFETLGVFDLETTGIDVKTSRIVSAHVGVIGPDGTVLEQREWLADPGIEIPVQASAVHGITTERARAEGRASAEVVAEIVAALADLFSRDIPVVAYNAAYDLSLLRSESLRHGIDPLYDPSPIIDPLVIDKAVDRYRKGKRTLEVSAEFFGVTLEGAHDAGADAVAAGRVAQALARKFPTELGTDAMELHARQIGWAAEQAASFTEYMRRNGKADFYDGGVWPVR